MATWKKIAFYDEVATLSAELAHDVGTAASAGVASDASKHDHVHRLGNGSIDAAALFATGVVDAAALGSNCVAGSEIDETATDIVFSEFKLTPKASATGTAEGTIFYDSDEDHLFVALP